MKINFTKNEQHILNHIPIEFKWIARDEDGRLQLFVNKPTRTKKAGMVIWYSNDLVRSANMFSHLFGNINFLNMEPVEIIRTRVEVDEKFLLSQFNPIYKWIARDEDGLLTLFDTKPMLTKPKKGKFKDQIVWQNFGKWHTLNLFSELFSSISNLATEPILIKKFLNENI